MNVKKFFIIITFLMTFIVNAFSINDSLVVSKFPQQKGHAESTLTHCDKMNKMKESKKDCDKEIKKTDCQSKKCDAECCDKCPKSNNIVFTENTKTVIQLNQKEKFNEELRNEIINRTSSLYRPPIK